MPAMAASLAACEATLIRGGAYSHNPPRTFSQNSLDSRPAFLLSSGPKTLRGRVGSSLRKGVSLTRSPGPLLTRYGFESSRGGLLGGGLERNGCKTETRRKGGMSFRAEEGGASYDLSLDPIPKKSSSIEVDQLDPRVRDSTMRAVDELGLRVTVGDVASKAGLKLADAERALKALAADANGFLEVSDEGDVLFCLPSDYRNVLLQKSFRMRAEPFLQKAGEVGNYLVRVTFGTTLLASIVLVYTTIVILATSASSSDRDNRSSRNGGFRYRSGPSLYFDLSDLLWYWDPYYHRRRGTFGEPKGMNFFESVFSFVFGDGDPNVGRDNSRWQALGKFIAEKGGVVTAEELAPFLDPPPAGYGNEDESYVLPALQRFDGTPEVDEQGNLLYRFPALQRTAKDLFGFPVFRRRDDSEVREEQAFYKEKTWTLSQAPSDKKVLAIGLGLANLAGVVILSTMLRNPQLARELGIGLVSFVQKTLPFFQGYAASFFAIPAIRWFVNKRKNAEIERRNSARMSRARQLKEPSAPLQRKLLNAREKAEKVVISKDKVIYSTEKDFAEQDIEAAEWSRRLRQREEDRSR